MGNQPIPLVYCMDCLARESGGPFPLGHSPRKAGPVLGAGNGSLGCWVVKLLVRALTHLLITRKCLLAHSLDCSRARPLRRGTGSTPSVVLQSVV